MTEKRKRGRPATGQTPSHGVRVPKALWDKAEKKANREGRNVSDVVRDCLDTYTREDDEEE
ncbi:hypothetical protein [Nonomuraea jabiensis]|uniref:hypothetical protein n=1 Tax=Nonomuraea jabiensis TaxID=882448 RepID=UPI003D7029FD